MNLKSFIMQHCSDRIFIFIKIITSMQASPTHIQAKYELKKKAWGTWAQEENFGPRPEPASDQTSLAQIHYSIGDARLFEIPIIGTRSFPISTMTFPGAAEAFDMKILRSLLLLHYLQLDSTIIAIHGSNYASRSFPRSKHCNANISMRVIMDNSIYLYMAISIIKRRDLSHPASH